MDSDCRSEDSWYWMRLRLSVCFGLVLWIDCPQRMLIVYVRDATDVWCLDWHCAVNKNIYSSPD